jgi:hypothetical protein
MNPFLQQLERSRKHVGSLTFKRLRNMGPAVRRGAGSWLRSTAITAAVEPDPELKSVLGGLRYRAKPA